MAFLALPFLFRDMKEAREIAQRFAPVFQERFLDRDLVLLGTFSLGFGRLFTGKKAGDLEEITALRTWVWKGDPLGEAIFRGLGFKNLVPLDMTDVLPALRYGLLDAFSGTCYTISVFQWFPHAGYMIPMNWGYTFGGIALRREAFARISPGDRDTVRRVMAELLLSVEAESLAKEEETRRILASVEGMGETRLSSHEVVLLEDRAGQVYEIVAEIVQARDLLQSILGARDALRGAPRLQRAPPRVTKPASGEAWGEGPNGRLPDPQRAGTDG